MLSFGTGRRLSAGRSWQHIRRARQGTGLPAKSNSTKCPVGWSTLCKVGRVWEWNSSGTLPTRASQHLHSEQGICTLATESRGRVAASKSIGLARMEEKPRVHPRKSWGTPDKYSPRAAAILPAVMRSSPCPFSPSRMIPPQWNALIGVESVRSLTTTLSTTDGSTSFQDPCVRKQFAY